MQPEALSPELSKQAIVASRRELQTDLWSLLHVLYPPPQYYWSESVHRPICEFFVKKNPDLPLAGQDSIKHRLYLDPRNHFKTTIDICDIVQWILCFPNVRILIASGIRDRAIEMLTGIKAHFQYNETLRFFFPECCPKAKKAADFGSQHEFTCPARAAKTLLQPTCSIASPDSTVASAHYDVEKFDDLVNETNSRTAEALRQVIQWFKLTNPLLEPYGYRDVIGTRYDYSDLYGDLLGDSFDDSQDFVGRYHHGYLVAKRSCFLADGTPLFPERFTRERLEAERQQMGTFLFSTQYLNRPIPSDAQFFSLPLVERALIPRKKLPKKRVYFTTFDLAISQSVSADRTAIVTCSIAPPSDDVKMPHIYVEDLRVGHFHPNETIDKLYTIQKQYRPAQIRTEEVLFTKLLDPLVKTEAARRNMYLPLVWMRRDSRESKEARIASMQAWFERGEIHICDDLMHREELVLELTRFPKYRYNDIIDALSDQLTFIPLFLGSTGDDTLIEMSDKHGDPVLGLI